MLSPETLLKEYKQLSEALNKILNDNNVSRENLNELPIEILMEVSRINKKLFEINQQLVEIIKQKNNPK